MSSRTSSNLPLASPHTRVKAFINLCLIDTSLDAVAPVSAAQPGVVAHSVLP